MAWTDLTERAEFLRKLFPDPPSLDGVRVFEVGFHQDGPRILIRFDLNEFPKEPPAKWTQSGANKVQIRLMCIGVQKLEMRGWTTNNIADVQMAAIESGGVRLVAKGEGFYLQGSFEHIVIDGVSAYSNAVG